MKTTNLMLTGALLAVALSACAFDGTETEALGVARQGVGGTGSNNVDPVAVDKQVLKRATTNLWGITAASNADPIQLCQGGTVTASGCTMKTEWQSWLYADVATRAWMMKGIAKCSVESSFAISTSDGAYAFPGQWPIYTSWKTGRLTGQDNRERMSACILSLLNGNNESLKICIIGPGGAPFSDACEDPNINLREGGFFGDLFAATPTAYIAGPDSDDVLDDGRVCTSNQSSYCCAEDDLSCPHHIVLAGAILGSPPSFTNKRCNSLATSGSFQYCTSYFSTREPGRNYTNVFTTFVPSGS